MRQGQVSQQMPADYLIGIGEIGCGGAGFSFGAAGAGAELAGLVPVFSLTASGAGSTAASSQ
jgi:hypothetical protein